MPYTTHLGIAYTYTNYGDDWGTSEPSIFKTAEERLQVFDLGGVLGHLPGPWGRSLRLVRRGWLALHAEQRLLHVNSNLSL